MGAQVMGIDAVEKNIKVAAAHAVSIVLPFSFLSVVHYPTWRSANLIFIGYKPFRFYA
jgi:2-polyprenyl-3-methyl-5-hydroxy-6-metoxy-1,4-benzoquinol methylase